MEKIFRELLILGIVIWNVLMIYVIRKRKEMENEKFAVFACMTFILVYFQQKLIFNN